MKKFKFKQSIQKVANSHHYVHLDSKIVDEFEKREKTRLLCVVDNTVSYSCQIKKKGETYFIMISASNLKKLKKKVGDEVEFEICQHPNPLGVDVPEVLEVFLSQDPEAQAIYNTFTDGKKRTLIFAISRVKNIDLQVQKITDFLLQEKIKTLKKKSSQ